MGVVRRRGAGLGTLDRQWRRFTAWFTRGNGWTGGYIAVVAVGAAFVMVVGLLFIVAAAKASQNPCDRVRKMEEEYASRAEEVEVMDEFLGELEGCYAWLTDHPDRRREYPKYGTPEGSSGYACSPFFNGPTLTIAVSRFRTACSASHAIRCLRKHDLVNTLSIE